MGLTGYARAKRHHTPEQKKRPAWVVGGVTILSFVALM